MNTTRAAAAADGSHHSQILPTAACGQLIDNCDPRNQRTPRSLIRRTGIKKQNQAPCGVGTAKTGSGLIARFPSTQFRAFGVQGPRAAPCDEHSSFAPRISAINRKYLVERSPNVIDVYMEVEVVISCRQAGSSLSVLVRPSSHPSAGGP